MNKTKNYEIVSLGVNCLPRTLLTINNIKPRKIDGELSCPFDLVSHKPERILYYIKTDFADYFDDLFFVIRKRHFFDFRNKGLWQKQDNTKFFHDKDCYAADKEKLVARIKNRIKNFNTILSSERPIIFVMTIFEDFDGIEELYNLLRQKSKTQKLILIILGFGTTPKYFNNNIYFLNLELPVDNYKSVWNTKKFRESQVGKYLEKCICEYIRKVIKKEFERIETNIK